MLRLGSALIGLCGPGAAHAQSHAEQLTIYAQVLSATTFAEQACPGFRADASTLARMRVRARVADTEDRTLADKIRESTAAIAATYARSGQGKWCADTYSLLGPGGELVAGALKAAP
ncbi:hypothetical protein R1A27_32270 (plasmid) [Methylobacterium sp. NMS12]|uniref:hypothetical protein n=1 Tax=Methylobacterium sp. NMS12 TaxID=3079766 RepID=UPI003F883A45